MTKTFNDDEEDDLQKFGEPGIASEDDDDHKEIGDDDEDADMVQESE